MFSFYFLTSLTQNPIFLPMHSKHEARRVQDAQRDALARTYVEAVPFDRASHFNPAQLFEKTGGMSEAACECFSDGPRIIILPHRPLNAYLAGETPRTIVPVTGDISKLCAIIEGDLIPRLRSSARNIHSALTASWSSSRDYFTGLAAELMTSATGSQSAMSRIHINDEKSVRYYREHLLTPLSQYGRIAVAFAAIYHARQLHAHFDITAPITTQLYTAVSNRIDRKQGGAPWLAALFADVLSDLVNPDFRPEQNRAALWCARILMDGLEKIRQPVPPERSHEILLVIKAGLERLPKDLQFSDYSVSKGEDVRIARWEELDRVNELCRQREEYFARMRGTAAS
jgi:hypothetical protein